MPNAGVDPSDRRFAVMDLSAAATLAMLRFQSAVLVERRRTLTNAALAVFTASNTTAKPQESVPKEAASSSAAFRTVLSHATSRSLRCVPYTVSLATLNSVAA